MLVREKVTRRGPRQHSRHVWHLLDRHLAPVDEREGKVADLSVGAHDRYERHHCCEEQSERLEKEHGASVVVEEWAMTTTMAMTPLGQHFRRLNGHARVRFGYFAKILKTSIFLHPPLHSSLPNTTRDGRQIAPPRQKGRSAYRAPVR